MINTNRYIVLIIVCLFISSIQKRIVLQVITFFSLYLFLFIFSEYLDLFAHCKIWNQQEITSQCYDWFVHYLNKDYGVINGQVEFDLTENIYNGKFDSSNRESILNKYNLLFESLQLTKGKKLLDCGCGTGAWMSFCKERGVEVVGLTLSKEQQNIVHDKGMSSIVQDYRMLNSEFIKQFDAISLLGSAEHITDFSSFYTIEKDAYRDYSALFEVLRQYLKPNGRILVTVLVQGKPESERSTLYDRLQIYVMMRHYGGYYSTTDTICKSIKNNGLEIVSIEDYTRDYHWTSIAEPMHFGHWFIPFHENPLDKLLYFLKGLCTDPFLIHHWLYYALDSWMWQLGGYQTKPLTDEQIKNAVANLKYFLITLP
jgi:cyclopropane fatty-acyl-phospholipid synthase-like methyltransferase